jgi:predicted  nucleic acid-binding Zn-ribbon protein
MGPLLSGLLALQAVERQLTHVRGRLKSRKNAVAAQETRIQQLKAQWQALHDKAVDRRKQADRLELELRSHEEQIVKLRGNLNTARNNKEYAAILTQINTLKADDSKLEEEGLKIIQDADAIKAQADAAMEEVKAAESRLGEIQAASGEEIAKLDKMVQELSAQRADAAGKVPPDALKAFERTASSHDGDAMAVIEVHGRRPPFEYICGGCFMSLSPENANALRTRDEIRTCNNCGRILYMEAKEQA